MTLTLKTAASVPVVNVPQAKEHLRVDDDTEDDLIDRLITIATECIEDRVEVQLLPAVWELALDEFPRGLIELRRPPVLSLVSLKYFDVAGVEQTLAAEDYQLDTRSRPARLLPAVGTCWPSTRQQLAAVVVEFNAGFGDPTLVPFNAKLAVLQLVAHWFNHREAIGSVGNEIVFGVDWLLDGLRWKR